MRVFRVTAVIAVAAAVAASAACGARPDHPRGEVAVVHPSWTGCDDNAPESRYGADATALPRVGRDFAPTAAIVCAGGPQSGPDGGTDMVVTEGRAEDIAALLTALRLPDLPRTNGACTMDLPVVPWFALVDADGRWIRPGLPTDGCSKIRIEVRNAVRDLKLTPVSSRTTKEIESAGARAAGCGQTWADVISMEVRGSRPPAGFSYPLAPATRLRRCVYRVPAGEQGSAKPAGAFEYGGVLPADRRASIEAAIASTGPVRDCSTLASRFALLTPADGGGRAVYVELDGCQRIIAEPVEGPLPIGQADRALIELLNTR